MDRSGTDTRQETETRPVGEAPTRFTDDYLPYLLAQASAIACAEFAEPIRDARLSAVAWRILATLCDENAMTIGALSRVVLTQQPRVTQVIGQLEADGLVERRRDRDDRRQTNVHITPAGRARISGLLGTAKDRERFALESLTPAELAQLKALLRRLVEDAARD